jgi:IS5 family transposase
MRFLDLELEDPAPDATTIWLSRGVGAGEADNKLFERFGRHLEAAAYIARGGQIIDATIVPVPKQRNTKEENEAIKAGKTPQGWEQQPAKHAQKDKDARWTKKNDESFYGYKNHLGVDKVHKLLAGGSRADRGRGPCNSGTQEPQLVPARSVRPISATFAAPPSATARRMASSPTL